ncbi:MAG TPA: peptide ABC transporter substrate-binding protein [Acidimicrobiia bacterium]
MKRYTWLGLLAAFALVLAACGTGGTTTTAAPSTTAPDGETSTTGEGPTGEAGQGGNLQLLMWQAPSIVNGMLSNGTKDTMAASLVLEPLANFGPETEIIPALAEEVPTIENGGQAEDLMSVTWTLKEGLLWSDGTPVTAEDAVFTWEYCMNPDTGCTQSGAFQGVESVEAVDDRTIKINFTAPTAYPYLPFVGAVSPILQKAQMEECVGRADQCTEQNNYPIGTGPYKVSNFVFEDTVEYEVNENYRDFANGKPFFGTVTIKGGGDAEAAARSVLEIGEADYAWNLQVAPDILEPMIAAGNGQLFVGFAANVEHLNLNQTNPDSEPPSEWMDGNNPHPVFHNNPEFAKALSLAIDREELTRVGYGVAGKPTCNVWPSPPAVSTTHDWCLTQDIDQANAILDGLGYMDTNGDGTREHPEFGELIFDFNTSTNGVRQSFQQLIESYWGQIGIGARMRNTDASVYFGNEDGADNINRFVGDIQMYTFVPLPGGQSHFAQYTTAEITGAFNNYGGSNLVRYSNPEFDALFDQLSTTTDQDERNEIIKQLSDLVVGDGAVIPLVWRASASAFKNDIKGYGTLNGWDSELWNIADWYRE